MRTAQQQLIHMVNQIAANNQSGTLEDAAKATSSHMLKFWARSMKADIIEYLETDGADLSEASKAAVKLL